MQPRTKKHEIRTHLSAVFNTTMNTFIGLYRVHLLFAVVTRLLWELQIVIYCWEFIEWSFKYLNLPCVPSKLCNKMCNPLRTLNYFLMCLYSVTNCKLCILCDAKYVFKQLKKSVVCKRKKKDKGNCVCWPC